MSVQTINVSGQRNNSNGRPMLRFSFMYGRQVVSHVGIRANSWFFPHDAMRKCGLCRHAVSVRLSVTFVYSVETNKQIFNFFHHRVAASFYTVSKKLHFCFCQNFVKFFMNFNKFWKIDSKVTEIVCYIYIYIFHLTWPTSLRYLVKRDVVNFYPTLDLLQSDWSDLVLKWRGHTVVTT